MNEVRETQMRAITERKEELARYLTYAWFFKTWYEKIILVVLGTLGLWKLIELVGEYLL